MHKQDMKYLDCQTQLIVHSSTLDICLRVGPGCETGLECPLKMDGRCSCPFHFQWPRSANSSQWLLIDVWTQLRGMSNLVPT